MAIFLPLDPRVFRTDGACLLLGLSGLDRLENTCDLDVDDVTSIITSQLPIINPLLDQTVCFDSCTTPDIVLHLLYSYPLSPIL
jgi:hypothetical protein